MARRKNPRSGPTAGSFKPGQSGCPGGRKKLTPDGAARLNAARALAAENVEEAIRVIVGIMLNKAEESRVRLDAARTIADRALGKASQAVELTGSGGGPVETAVTVKAPSDGHLAAILAIMDRAGGLALPGSACSAGPVDSSAAKQMDPTGADSTAGGVPSPREP